MIILVSYDANGTNSYLRSIAHFESREMKINPNLLRMVENIFVHRC